MSRKDFFSQLNTLLSPDFTAIKYLKTSNQDKADTLLPLLIINIAQTDFDKSGTRQYRERLKMTLTIIIQETNDPLADLANKEETIIKKMLTDVALKQYVQDLKIIKTTASNQVDQYQKQGAVSSELEIEALFAVSY